MTTANQSHADTVQQTLALIRQAETLQQNIVEALREGNRENAEYLCLQHQQIVLSIPFAELTDELPEKLISALQQLLAGNQTLTAMTKDIQREISQQLSQVQKGIAGSRAYTNIDKQHD